MSCAGRPADPRIVSSIRVEISSYPALACHRTPVPASSAPGPEARNPPAVGPAAAVCVFHGDDELE